LIVEIWPPPLDFYQSKLGFNLLRKDAATDNATTYRPFVGRDKVMINFKHIPPEIHPHPDHSRHEFAAGTFTSTSSNPRHRMSQKVAM